MSHEAAHEIDRAYIQGNKLFGVYFELNSNGNWLGNSIVTGTRYQSAFAPGIGVGICASEDNTIVHATITRNAGGGVSIFGDARGRAAGNGLVNCLLHENLAGKADCPSNARELVISGWAGQITVGEALANLKSNFAFGNAIASALAGTAAPSNGWRALFQLSPDPTTTKTAYHNDASVVEARLQHAAGNVVIPPDAFDDDAPPEGMPLFDLVRTGAIDAERLERIERLMREDYRSWDRETALNGPVPVGAKRPPKRKKAA